MTIEELLAGESKNIEFKETLPEKSIKYMKTVVAFANGTGGRIVFGIRDEDHLVVGVQSESIFRTVDAITNAISDSCEPAITPDIVLQTIEGKTIIIVEISAGRQRPYYIKSQGMDAGTYIRVSGTTRPADREQIKDLYYESEGRSYDCVARKDLTVSEEDITSLCKSMKEVALNNCKNDIQCSGVKDVTKNVLLSWGILAEEDGKIYPTNAYVFLLGKDPFLSRIQCGVFKGSTRSVFVDKREYSGTLWEQVEEAYQFVLRNIHLGAKIEGIYRKDIYEIPPESIRELIINAAVHCSFLQSSLIQVAVYDDRLEITSPGGLLPGVTLEKMREGYSKVRNRAIASAFSYMNIIEQWGSGIPKIINEVSNYGLRQPEFLDMESALRINIYRNQNQNYELKTDTNSFVVETNCATNETNSETNETDCATNATNLSSEELTVLELVQEKDDITQKQLHEQTGISLGTIKRILPRLQEKGVLKRIGNLRKGKWKVIK
jgi:predicted HTH transcriptional regulator